MKDVSVVVLSGAGGWHERRLSTALTSRGCRLGRGSLSDIDLTTSTATGFSGLNLDAELPDAVIVRGINAGSFEEITRRLDVLHALEFAGVKVINNARSIERSVDKGMTSHLLGRAGIATPLALTSESAQRARAFTTAQLAAGHRLVAKPLFGSQGKGLVLIEDIDQLPSAEDSHGVWHLQQFVERSEQWFDWRVLVCKSSLVSRMTRRSQHWITNRAQGAECQASSNDDDIVATAIQAADVLGCWYAGVDLVRDEMQKPMVLEVNGVPAWQGVEAVENINVAERLTDALLAELNSNQRTERPGVGTQ